MNFQNPFFFLFFLVILCLHYGLPRNKRWIVLLAGSLVFYLSLGVYYLLIPLALVILISFWTGRQIHRSGEGVAGRNWFILGAGVNVLILVFFRFYPLVAARWMHPGSHAPVIAAFGVSFYVFQAISYLADIYLGKIEPEAHLGYFSLYIAFFPKILQGPIERGKDLLPQLHDLGDFDYENARAGAIQFTYGLFKKVAVADRLGGLVDPIYGNVSQSSGLALLFATFIYAFQLYYDFSGYTDMALGIARVFNIRLTNNFNLPYLATSIAEFWRRWHISFSRWIMDYLFKPIQLSLRKWGIWGGVVAILITFLLSGLWHGASAGFIIWGLLQGIYLSVDMLYSPLRKKLYRKLKLENSPLAKAWQVFLTFNLVSFAWIFFRASNISDAIAIVKKILPWRIWSSPEGICLVTGTRQISHALLQGGDVNKVLTKLGHNVCQTLPAQFSFFPDPFHDQNVLITVAAVFLVFWIGVFGKRMRLSQKPALVRWIVYLSMILFILAAGLFLRAYNPGAAPYLYFKF